MKIFFTLIFLTGHFFVMKGMAQTPEENEKEIVSFAEEMPEYPGGQDSMISFISRNLIYPKYEQEKKISGRVVVTFVIDSDGKIKYPEVVKSVSPGLDSAALNIIRQMPQWKPGKQNYKPIAVKFTLPLQFKL
ncbi:MAG: energy transducer TonB [Bacteroidota bacterium]